ncbi:DUF3310 domain-containing protein [Psychrobacter cibarius]|nr:DUF3310 domain-containing protein [Psychrobacter cibarius]
MSDKVEVNLPSVASISCMRCKEAHPINSIEYACFMDGNCQKCRAELSGKFADGKSLMVGADMVNHPPHYKDASGVECIEVTRHMQFCGGSCFKYLYRCGKKHDDIEDLKKAVKYADWAWENEEVVLIKPMRLIEKIAVHREGNIKQAMLYIAEDFWAMAKRSIEAEIARLESE